ncbi:MAG TPA: hypothetical protein VLV31_02755 [Candidatus Acidoferrales bacterium]|nr:hypothetical protein [Candidatus Acidoferrales bacterium]
MQKAKGGTKSRQLTLAAALAAVYFVLRAIPTFQMVGTSSHFTTGDFLLTSIALVAGLWSGSLAIVVGTVAAYAVSPPVFFGLDFLPALANVAIAGLLLSRRRKAAAGVYLIVLLAFVVSPYSLLFGYGYVPYVWLHLAGLAVLVSPISAKIPIWVHERNYRGIVGIASLAFIGTMAQHLVGGLLYEFSLGFALGVNPQRFVDTWRVIFWLYPEERMILTVISTIIAVGVFRSFERLGR